MASDSPTYAPMLAGSSQTVPAGDAWRFEIKWDGFRAIARIEGDEVRLWSRNGKALEAKHRSVAEALPHALTHSECVLDGELCAFDDTGVPRFELFQRGEGSIAYVVFDLLELDGEPVIAEPWSRRRELLAELIVPGAPIVVLSQVYDDGEALLDAAGRRGLEGIMAKRVNAPYRPGRRSDDWRKIKLREEATFLIAGYTSGQGARAKLGALLLATDDLEYAGNCGSGLSDEHIREVLRRLEPLRREISPLRGAPRLGGVVRSRITWVEPSLACEVEFTEWTRDRRLRAPVFKRLVEEDAVKEPVEQPTRELKLTNQGKVFFPDEKITKGDLVEYYRSVAHVLLPYLRDRPITLVRYPDGIDGQALLPEAGARPHARLDADRVPAQPLRRRRQGHPLPHGRRHGRPALDDQQRLHRRACALRPRAALRLARLRALRPRPLAGIHARSDGPRGTARARRPGGAGPARRGQDLERRGHAPRSAAAPRPHLLAGALARAARGPGARAGTPRPGHDRVGQEPPPRRADRLQPGRLRPHDGGRVLRAATAGRAGLDAADLGRGRVRRVRPGAPRPCAQHCAGSSATATPSRARSTPTRALPAALLQ